MIYFVHLPKLFIFFLSNNHHLQLRNHLLTLVDPGNGIPDKLVNDCLGTLLLIHNSCGLTHQERSCVVHGLVIDIVTECC
jgi:hypothetical protein